MNIARKSIIALCLVAPAAGWANAWSGCQTITSVSNYLAHSDAVYLTLSPGIGGCSAFVAGASGFRLGQNGVNADNIKSLLATSLSAYLSGKQIMLYYDDTAPSCYSMMISIGGYAGQCN